MLNYIKNLKSQYDHIKNSIPTEENKFKLIELNVELSTLESKINYCINLVVNKYKGNDILGFAKKCFSDERINNAKEEAQKYNIDVVEKSINRTLTQKKEYLDKINDILSKHPDADKPENKDSDSYKRIQHIKADIAIVDNHILETQQKEKNFIDFLSFEEKNTLVNNLLEVNNAIEDDQSELLDKAKSYYAPLELLHKATYPLEERIKELTKDKDSSLAKYLLENKEAIDRLTVKSNHTAVSSLYTQKVKKIEDEYGVLRRREFAKFAKKAKIEDIVNEQGQFNSKKIYYVDEHYEKFNKCQKELLSTDETKEKIKFLLKKLDSLNILNDEFDVGESGFKEYGFAKFIKLKYAFIEAINETPADEEKIRSTLEELKQQETGINTIYELIKETLGDTYESTPGNVDSYRSLEVPPCFKNNLSINSKFNSLYIMLSFIKEKNLDIDEFVNNPIKFSAKEMEDAFQKRNLDNILAGKSKGEAIAFLSDIRNASKPEDPYKFTRCYELIVKSETNEAFATNNHISSIAFNTVSGDYNRAACIGGEYFNRRPIETLEYLLVAKKDKDGKIPYLSCYVPPYPIYDDLKTNRAIDEKETVVEQISRDENIKETFYEAIEALRYFSNYRKNQNGINSVSVHSRDVYKAVQLLATKIIVTLDLKGNSKDQKRGYDKQFVDDVYNIIENPKKVAQLKGFKFHKNQDLFDNIKNVVDNKDRLIKNYEKNMLNYQKPKEAEFIAEFERINKEIDLLDEQADKISANLEKGATNKQIEDIAALQREKFIELQKLQNNRIDQLKEDLQKGRISKYYFDIRTEQVKLLDNIKDIPAMFIHEEAKYKNFKTYAKEILKIDIKTLSNEKLETSKNEYNLLIKKSEENKRLYLINNVLTNSRLSSNKSFNYDKIEKINIDENVNEMKELSDQLLSSDAKRKAEVENQNANRNLIEVILPENETLLSNEIVVDNNNNEIKKNLN